MAGLLTHACADNSGRESVEHHDCSHHEHEEHDNHHEHGESADHGDRNHESDCRLDPCTVTVVRAERTDYSVDLVVTGPAATTTVSDATQAVPRGVDSPTHRSVLRTQALLHPSDLPLLI
ncbi:MAG: hypothetical protein ACYTHJ_08030 [Planctomycetota bacterium]